MVDVDFTFFPTDRVLELLKASNFKAENTVVEVAGSGDAEIFASENLQARVVGSGDIHYAGNPKKEDIKISGSGSIEKD